MKNLKEFHKELLITLNFCSEIINSYTQGSLEITTDDKGVNGLVTSLDYKFEKDILLLIGKFFPSHRIFSEEKGLNYLDSEYLWVVDPLDGTSNLKLQIPLVGVSITLLHKNKPIYSTLYDLHTRKVISSIDFRFIPEGLKNLSEVTLSLINGYSAVEKSKRLSSILEPKVKRLLKMWAPTIDFISLLSGGLDAIVIVDSEIEDQIGGIFMCQNLGYSIIDFEGSPYRLPQEFSYILPSCIISRNPEISKALQPLIKKALD